MTGRLLAVAGGALAVAGGAAAAPPLVALSPPTTPIRSEPPLQPGPGYSPSPERRLPRRIDASVAVRTTVDESGRPLRIVALDQLLVSGIGDYSFSVPVPAVAAKAGPRSASQPGLRTGAVVWQGFTLARRRLDALIVLDPALAAGALPLRIRIDDRGVTLVNATRATATAATGRASAAAVGSALDAVRAGKATQPLVRMKSSGTRRLGVSAGVLVAGTYRFAGERSRRVRARVGATPLRLPGKGEIRALDLTASVEDPTAALRPPHARTWAVLAARGGLGPDPVGLAERRLLESALARQYQAFIMNADPLGKASTVYRYALGTAAATPTGETGGSGPWVAAAVAAIAVIAVAGGVVAWAHS